MFNFVQQNGGENGGIANYLSQNDAYAAGILSVERHGAVKLAVGMSQYQSPRDAIKIMSKKQYSEGVRLLLFYFLMGMVSLTTRLLCSHCSCSSSM